MYEHNQFFHFFLNKELNQLFISTAIRTFAISLTGIFIPIYLYQLGYSFSSIFLFFAFVYLFHMIFSFPSSKIAYRFGLKHSILFSIPFLIIFFFLMLSLEYYRWPLILLAFFAGIHLSLFWFAYHIDFSKFSRKKVRGTQISASKILVSIVSVLGPIFGSIIITIFGFKILFIVVSILFLGSAIPLFMTKEIHEPINFSFKGFFKSFKIKDAISYMGRGAEIRLALIFWPLFIFIFIFGETYLSLGLTYSITFLSSLIFIFLAGKFSDINRRLFLKIGVISNSIIWIIKSFLVTPLQIFIISIFYGASRTSIEVSFAALNYDKTDDKNRTLVILQREMFINLGGFIFLLIMSFVSDYILEAIRYGGPLSSLMMFFF